MCKAAVALAQLHAATHDRSATGRGREGAESAAARPARRRTKAAANERVGEMQTATYLADQKAPLIGYYLRPTICGLPVLSSPWNAPPPCTHVKRGRGSLPGNGDPCVPSRAFWGTGGRSTPCDAGISRVNSPDSRRGVPAGIPCQPIHRPRQRPGAGFAAITATAAACATTASGAAGSSRL
jgi:hypothetical protein